MNKSVPAFALVLSVLLWSALASAQAVIKMPGAHPRYTFDAEPHLVVRPFKGEGIGPGFRGTIVLVDNGFITKINNSVGLGFGADFLFSGRDEVILPIVMQWNFWLSRKWSVFGEPGASIRLHDHKADHFYPFTFYAGGRFLFSDSVALVMRVGHPTFSVGVSFLL